MFLTPLFFILFVTTCLSQQNKNPTYNHSITKRTSYADGTGYGCSFKFRPHCWKYCTGNSGNWCYTVWDVIMGDQSCSDDHDCSTPSACQGWCAWNSQRGCAKACREETPKPQQQTYGCGRRPYWQCQSQSNYYNNYGSYSRIAKKAVWVSPDVDVEANVTTRGLGVSGNKVTSKEFTGPPHTFLWFPIGEIQQSTAIFYWMFTINDATEGISLGLSDLGKTTKGWSNKGLYYGGNLSDGSKLLIGNYGPKLKSGDKVGLVAKIMDGKLKIYFFLNDVPLGLAFDVPSNTLDGIFPVVRFNGKGSVTIDEKNSSQIPTKIEPEKTIQLEGDWTLTRFGNDQKILKPVTMVITKINLYDGFAYRLKIHIVNRFMGQLSPVDANNWKAEIFDKTVVQGKADEMKFESEVVNSIQKMNNFSLKNVENELYFQSKDAAGISVWKQLKPKATYVTTNPFA